MSSTFWTILALVVYFVAMIAIGLYAFRRTTSHEGYMLADRQLHPFTAALSAGASDMSGWLLMGLPGAIYISGLCEAWIAVGLTVGAWFNWKIVAPRLRSYSVVARDSITIPTFLENRLHDSSHVLRICSGLVILFFFTFYVSSGMVAGGTFFQATFDTSYLTGMLVVSGVVVLYTFVGGFLAVSYTDVVQGLLIMTVILLCVMAFSAYKIVSILLEYHNGKSAYDDLADIAGTGKSDRADIPGSSGEDDPEFLNINWEALTAKGSDVKGWLRSRGTSINYPVVQGSDNDYYLTHIMTGELSRYGSLFIDYRCEDPFNRFMTVIYGHRMLNDSMFNRLGDYFDDADYTRAHPVMQLYTPDCNYYLEIFGAMHVDANNTSVYDMFIPEDDQAARQAYIDMILAGNELAGYSGGVSVSGSDRIVMMSTCTYDYGDDRLVVWGKLTPMDSSAG